MIITHHNRGRRNLFKLWFRNIPLWRLELITVAAATAAAGLRSRRLHDWNIEIRRDQRYLLLRLLDDFLSDIVRPHEDRRDHYNVRNQRKGRAAFLVVVEAPNVPYWYWL